MSFSSVDAVLVAVALIGMLLVAYPYAIYPAILALLPEVRQQPAPAAMTMGRQFAMLFCAYNEFPSMEAKLANLKQLKARYPDLEVLVYDDGSSDGTREILRTHPDLLTLIVGEGRRGKAHGMKHLVTLTRREYLIFTDANVLLEESVPIRLLSYYQDSHVGGVCGHLEYLHQSGTTTERAGRRYWTLEETIKARESATGNVMGGDGSIFSVRRALYPSFPDTVQDDFTVTMAVVFAGSRLVYAKDVVAYERLVSKPSDEYRRKIRIAARAFHTHRQMRRGRRRLSARDRYKYVSHKVIRWWGALFGLIAMIAVLVVVGRQSVLAAVVLGVLGAVVLQTGQRIPKVGLAIEIWRAMLATLIGVLLAISGRTFATWTPPKSRSPLGGGERSVSRAPGER